MCDTEGESVVVVSVAAWASTGWAKGGTYLLEFIEAMPFPQQSPYQWPPAFFLQTPKSTDQFFYLCKMLCHYVLIVPVHHEDERAGNILLGILIPTL